MNQGIHVLTWMGPKLAIMHLDYVSFVFILLAHNVYHLIFGSTT